jgi:5'-nucleotidase
VGAFEVTFLGRRVYRDLVDVRHDLRGRAYYWIGGPEAEAEDLPGSDMSAVKAGRASVTPLMLDLTDRALLDRVRGWQVPGFERHEGPAQAVLQAEAEGDPPAGG